MFSSISDKEEEKLKFLFDSIFGENSDFSSGSGKGFEVRMFKRLRSILKKITYATIEEKSISVTTSLGRDQISIDDIIEQLQSYYWTTEDEELASLGHHYEYEEMEDVKLISAMVDDSSVKCKMAFNSSVTIYMDNEDDDGLTLSFPTEVYFEVQDNGSKWEINEESVRTKFDTSSY